MNGGLVFLMVIAFFGILYLIFHSMSEKRWKKYCGEIMASNDVDFVLKHLSSEFPEQVRKTAEARLWIFAQETDDPDLILKINDHLKLDHSILGKIQERIKPEDLILKIFPKIELDESTLENALSQISDIDTLADITENKSIPFSIRKQAMIRISDKEILYPILMKHYSMDDAEAILNEEEMAEFGKYLCRHGRHDFDNDLISLDEETVKNLEGDLRWCERFNKCRRCGKFRGLIWNVEDHGWDYYY